MPGAIDIYIILCFAGAMLVRLGFLAYATGLTRAKHAAAIAVRSLLDVCFSLVAYALANAVIHALGFYNGRVVSWDQFVANLKDPMVADWNMATVLLAGCILAGSLGERCRFWAYIIAAAALGGLVMPAIDLWTMATVPGDWLNRARMGNSTAFYAIAAAAFVAVGIKMVGPRRHKYHHDGSTSLIPGHNLPLAIFGAGLVMVGMVVLLGPPTRRPALMLLAIAAGGVVATFGTVRKLHVPDITLILSGMLGAAVAVSTYQNEPTGWTVLVGAGAGLLVPHFAFHFDTQNKFDDPIAGVAIFGVGGVWGFLASGLFFDGDAVVRLKMVGVGALAIAIIGGSAAIIGWIVFGLLKRRGLLLTTDSADADGLDLAEHDVAAYPDFQQNMIRSFHMREQ